MRRYTDLLENVKRMHKEFIIRYDKLKAAKATVSTT